MRRIVLTCVILGQMIQHVPDAALHASECGTPRIRIKRGMYE
jgi:hypothetical protein